MNRGEASSYRAVEWEAADGDDFADRDDDVPHEEDLHLSVSKLVEFRANAKSSDH